MTSPTESRVDENEVASNSHQRGLLDFNNFPLTRQSSIYSLTLEEVQNTLCEPGKTFGSMNMDEFLSNIWNVEEGLTGNSIQNNGNVHANGLGPPLHRQGSLSLPAPLSRMTVDEVWADIHREQAFRNSSCGNDLNVQRQPTYGEMTLEDFLVKAGIVQETQTLLQQQQNHVVPTNYPIIMGSEYRPSGYEYSAHGRRYINNGYGLQSVAGPIGSPISPVSSDGFGGGQVDNAGFGLSNGGGHDGNLVMSGRKRGVDGGVEKVVERRQRRMIKNRESAARSRARKQAYTVELEAELNNLKEINARLKDDVDANAAEENDSGIYGPACTYQLGKKHTNATQVQQRPLVTFWEGSFFFSGYEI